MNRLPHIPARFSQWGQWLLLFTALLGSIFAATLSRDAPLIILFIALYTIVHNLSLPLAPTRYGLISLIGLTSLLLLNWPTGVLALAAGLLLAEISYEVWRPLWPEMGEDSAGRRGRLGLTAVYIMALTISGWLGEWLYRPWHTLILPGALSENGTWMPLVRLSLFYFAIYVLGQMMLVWWLTGMGRTWLTHHLPRLLIEGILLPLGWLNALVNRELGLPAFVLLSLFLVGVALLFWVVWRSRFVLRRQMAQFASLNRVSEELRETLDLDAVLQRTFEQVSSIIPLERFAIMVGDASRFERPFAYENGRVLNPEPMIQPDDFSRWVIENGRPLEIDSGSMHYAQHHQLRPPQPLPTLWLGYPLTTSDSRTSGALVVHQTHPSRVVDRWSRELLLAIARQASDAIENALQHKETLRLYSLTDETLTRRARQLQAILNASQEGFLMLDTGGQVVLANDVAESFLKLLNPVADDIFSTQTAVAQLGYAPAELARLLQQIRDGKLPEPRQSIVAVQDKQVQPAVARYVERQEAPVLASDGRPLGWLLTFRDVTEQQERAEWRKQFTNMIVHDLRNPITTLLTGFDRAEYFKEPVSLQQVRQLTHTSRRVTINMLDMVDSLMDIARMEAGQLVADVEAMRLPKLIGRVLEDTLPLAFAKEIELTFSYPDDLPAVWGDEELMRRVMVNLIDNALKFTPAGGRINGFLGEEPAADDQHEAGVRCTLIDTGPGIPAEARDQIFERFVRIDQGGAQVRGTGVGLTFCKLALEAQNGRIWVEDAPEGGSCFVVTLPGIPHFEL